MPRALLKIIMKKQIIFKKVKININIIGKNNSDTCYEKKYLIPRFNRRKTGVTKAGKVGGMGSPGYPET